MGVRLLASVGLPDGNGHGLNIRRLAITAMVTTVAGLSAAAGANWAAERVGEAVAATAVVYSLPPIIHGPAGKPELGLESRVEALESKGAVSADDAATIAEFARSLRAGKVKK